MPNIKHIKMSPKDERRLANLEAENVKKEGLIDYVAVMADIEIPSDEEADNVKVL